MKAFMKAIKFTKGDMIRVCASWDKKSIGGWRRSYS